MAEFLVNYWMACSIKRTSLYRYITFISQLQKVFVLYVTSVFEDA